MAEYMSDDDFDSDSDDCREDLRDTCEQGSFEVSELVRKHQQESLHRKSLAITTAKRHYPPVEHRKERIVSGIRRRDGRKDADEGSDDESGDDDECVVSIDFRGKTDGQAERKQGMIKYVNRGPGNIGVPLESVIREMRTGDLVLFRGTDALAISFRFIELFEGVIGTFSHVGIIIKPIDLPRGFPGRGEDSVAEKNVWVFDSYTAYLGCNICDLVDIYGNRPMGVQLRDLRREIAAYTGERGDAIAWAPLQQEIRSKIASKLSGTALATLIQKYMWIKFKSNVVKMAATVVDSLRWIADISCVPVRFVVSCISEDGNSLDKSKDGCIDGKLTTGENAVVLPKGQRQPEKSEKTEKSHIDRIKELFQSSSFCQCCHCYVNASLSAKEKCAIPNTPGGFGSERQGEERREDTPQLMDADELMDRRERRLFVGEYSSSPRQLSSSMRNAACQSCQHSVCQPQERTRKMLADTGLSCSEFVAQIYVDIGVFPPCTRADHVAPNDFVPKGYKAEYGNVPRGVRDLVTDDRDNEVPWVFDGIILLDATRDHDTVLAIADAITDDAIMSDPSMRWKNRSKRKHRHRIAGIVATEEQLQPDTVHRSIVSSKEDERIRKEDEWGWVDAKDGSSLSYVASSALHMLTL